MQAFHTHRGVVAPLDRHHVDTDAIIPKQFLKAVSRYGFGDYLFDEWRYLDEGYYGQDCRTRSKNPDFILNQAEYADASILLARSNFGCGSSREHAPWALLQYGFKCVIAQSFADIFLSNAYKNGLLPVVLPEDVIHHLFALANAGGYSLSIDLAAQSITLPDQTQVFFEIGEFRKNCLLNGLDEVGLTLQHKDKIQTFEQSYYAQFPWLQKGIR